MAGLKFGAFAKPQAIGVRAGDVPKFGDLSMQEKLLMLGAALQGDTQGAMSVPMLAAARRRQAEEQAYRSRFAEQLRGVPMLRERALPNAEGEDISAAFSPQMESVRGKPASLRDMVPMLAEAYEKGYDVKGPLELLDKTAPKSVVVNGRVLDERDPDIYGKFYSDAPTKGAIPVKDDSGRQVGWMLENGTLEALSRTAEAEQFGKTRGGLVDVPMLSGRVVPMTGGEYLDTRAGRGGVPAPEGFGVKPSDAETKMATGRAENVVKAEGMESEAATEAKLDLPGAVAQAEEAKALLDKIRNHPKLDRRTGMSAAIPAITGEDVDFDALVAQVRGGTFLQAYERLKGGGQITEVEGKKAEEAIARLNQRQSREGFLGALDDLTSVIDAGISRAQSKASRAPTGGRKPSISSIPLADRIAEARRRGLIE